MKELGANYAHAGDLLSAICSDACANGAMHVQSTTVACAENSTLTSKEQPILKNIQRNSEPDGPSLFNNEKINKAGTWSHLQNEASAQIAHASPSAESAHASPNFPNLFWHGRQWCHRSGSSKASIEELAEMKRRNSARITPETLEITAAKLSASTTEEEQ